MIAHYVIAHYRRHFPELGGKSRILRKSMYLNNLMGMLARMADLERFRAVLIVAGTLPDLPRGRAWSIGCSNPRRLSFA